MLNETFTWQSEAQHRSVNYQSSVSFIEKSIIDLLLPIYSTLLRKCICFQWMQIFRVYDLLQTLIWITLSGVFLTKLFQLCHISFVRLFNVPVVSNQYFWYSVLFSSWYCSPNQNYSIRPPWRLIQYYKSEWSIHPMSEPVLMGSLKAVYSLDRSPVCHRPWNMLCFNYTKIKSFWITEIKNDDNCRMSWNSSNGGAGRLGTLDS